MPTNPAIALIADSPTSGTLGAGAVRTFKQGGKVYPGRERFLAKRKFAAGGEVDDPDQGVSDAEQDEPDVTAREQEHGSDIPAGFEAGADTKRETDLPGGFEEIPEGFEPAPKHEIGPGRAFAEEAAEGALPMAGSLAAMGVGAAAGAATPIPGGALVGGIAGGLLGAAGVQKAQDWVLEKLGIRDPEEVRARREQNPKASTLGQFAPALAAFSPGALSMPIKQRLATAGLMGAVQAGTDAAQGEFSPSDIALGALQGGLLPNARAGAQRLINAGEQAGARALARAGVHTPGRPDMEPGVGPENTAAVTDPAASPVADANGGSDGQVREPTPGARTDNTATAEDAAAASPAKDAAQLLTEKQEGASSEPIKAGSLGNAAVQAPPLKNLKTVGTGTSEPFADRNIPGNEQGTGYAKQPAPGDAARILMGDGPPPDVMAAMGEVSGHPAEQNYDEHIPARGDETDLSEGSTPPPEEYGQADNTPFEPAAEGPVEHPAVAAREARILPDTSQERGPAWHEAIQHMRDIGMDRSAIHAMETRGNEDLAKQYLREFVVGKSAAGEKPTAETGAKRSTQSEARQVSNHHAVAEEVFAKHAGNFPAEAPVVPAARKAYQERARAAVDEYRARTDHPDLNAAREAVKQAHPDWTPEQVEKQIAKVSKTSFGRDTENTERPPSHSWLMEMEKVASGKSLPPKKAMDAYTHEKGMRSGDKGVIKELKETVRQENQIKFGDRRKTVEGKRADDYEGVEPSLDREEAAPRELDETDKEIARLQEESGVEFKEPPEGFDVAHEESEEFSKPAKEMSVKEIQDLHDHDQMADNLHGLDHDDWIENERQQRASDRYENRGIDNGPARRVERTESKPQYEKDAEAAHEKTARLRAAREAAGAHRNEAKSLPLKDLKEFAGNEAGSIDPKRIGDFLKARGQEFSDWWDKNVMPNLTPHRVGKMGSPERQNALAGMARFGQFQILKGRGSGIMQKLLDAHYKMFEKADAGFNAATAAVSKAAHIVDRNMDFIRRLEKGMQQASPELQRVADGYRKLMDWAYAEERYWGSSAEYIADYFPHIWKDMGKYQDYLNGRINAEGPTWFQKKRMFELIDEARAAGLELKSTNPAELVGMRMLASVSMQSKMILAHQLNDLGLAYRLADAPKDAKSVGSRWMETRMPDGKSWLISPDIAPQWKNALARDSLWMDEGIKGSAYRAWMIAKNTWVPLKLGLSAFHALHVSHIHQNQMAVQGWMNDGAMGWVKGYGQGTKEVGQALAAAVADLHPMFKPLDNYAGKFKGLEALKSFHADPSTITPKQKFDIQLLQEGGMYAGMPEQFKIRAGRAFDKAMANGDVLGLAATAIPRLQEKFNPIQNVMFEHWIPSLKTHAYLSGAADLMARHPEYIHDEIARSQALTRLRMNTEERYGEMFYNNLNWNNTLKNLGIGVDLSLGWNLGFFNTVGGAAADAVRSGGIKAGLLPGRNAAEQNMHNAANKGAYVASYALTGGLYAAVMSWALSGDVPQGMDFVYPRAGGQNPDGSPRRLTTMFYNREPVQLYKHAEQQDSWLVKGVVPGPGALGEVLWNKTILQPVVAQMQNRDFFGYQVYDPNSPWYKQLYQRAKSAFGDLVQPVSMVSAEKAQQTGGGTRDKALAYAGFGPGPAYINKDAMQNRIQSKFYEGPGAATKPYENKERDQQRRDGRVERAMALQRGDQPAAQAAYQKLLKTGMTADQINKQKYGTADVYQYSRLDRSDQKAIMRDMTPAQYDKYITRSPQIRGKTRFELIAEWGKLHPKQGG